MEALLLTLVIAVVASLLATFTIWTARNAWSLPWRWWLQRRRRGDSLKIISDYRLRAASKFAEGLSTFVDVGATDDGTEVFAADISRRINGGAVLAVLGPSGGGKSFPRAALGGLPLRRWPPGRMAQRWRLRGEPA